MVFTVLRIVEGIGLHNEAPFSGLRTIKIPYFQDIHGSALTYCFDLSQ